MSQKQADLDRWAEAMAEVLRLELSPDYLPGIKANLKTAAKMAAVLEKAPLKDSAEPAPVYRA
jgi:hypothetical protein